MPGLTGFEGCFSREDVQRFDCRKRSRSFGAFQVCEARVRQAAGALGTFFSAGFLMPSAF